MLGNTLIDNSEQLKLVDTLNEIIALPEVSEICIATGYWDLKGTALIADALKTFLEKDEAKLRLLIGKDPNVCQKDLTAESYKNAKKYPQDFIKIDLQNVELAVPAYQKAAKLLIDYCSAENPKIEVHVFNLNENDERQFFHAKCYIFKGLQGKTYGIIGSSNFTQKGLQGNAELNFLDADTSHIMAEPNEYSPFKGHYFWFNEKWKLSDDWTKEFVVEVRNSPIGKAAKENENYTVLSPYETYIKFLQDQFAEIIASDGKIKEDDYLPKPKAGNFKKLTYQLEAVNQGAAIMKRHGGFILSDVVGLGKTYTALMVVKRHLLETGYKHPVLIITPPAIKQNWIDSIKFFDEDETEGKKLSSRITLTTIGCLDVDSGFNSEENERPVMDDFDRAFADDNYGMIVVDESHRFRNDGTIMYQKLDGLIGDIAARLEKQPYVVLISATPQNNAPYDLRNQIYLFQRNHNNATLQNLGKFGNKLESYFKEKQDNYKEYIKKEKKIDGKKILKTKEEREKDKAALIADSEDIRKRIIEPLVIRRTRTDIERYYKEDMKTQSLRFPKIQKPVAIPYEMGGDLGKLFNETINIIAPQVSHIDTDENGEPVLDFSAKAGEDALGYFRYRATAYLRSEKDRKRYEANNLTVDATSQRLAQIMELLLVKRLESSQAAFKESLHNLRRYTENMVRMWNANRIFICPDIDVNKELNDDRIAQNGNFENCLEVIARKAKDANKRHSVSEDEGVNREYTQNDFDENYIHLLNNDARLIENLCHKWDRQTNDPKMTTFIFKTASDFLDSTRNKNRKLVIFTECIATQKALVEKLNEMPIPDCKVLSITAANRTDMKDIIAANFDANYKGTKKDDYQILITTDVLAEGVNLHRANSILNYDSPWNATRLMQRLGRINRIGTDADKIWDYNFYPSTLGDNQINLKNRTYVKLQAFHELFGEDSQIYSDEEEVKHFAKTTYAETEECETPIMPFIAELKEYKENNEIEYKRLANLSGKIVSTVGNGKKQMFSALHEADKNNECLRSALYIANSDGGAHKVSQLEFFEALKPLARLEESDTDFALVKKGEKSVLNCYAADKQNSALSLRSPIRKDADKMQAAIKKIKDLYSLDLSKGYEEKLDEISNAIRDKNLSLIHKVMEMDLKNDGLGTVQVEADIDVLYRYTSVHAEDVKADVAIQFITK